MNRLDRYQLSVHASRLSSELNGVSRKTATGIPKFINLECPVCKSTKCCGLLPTENRDNYRLVCLRESCGLNSISLIWRWKNMPHTRPNQIGVMPWDGVHVQRLSSMASSNDALEVVVKNLRTPHLENLNNREILSNI